jgi:hypothetical protein
VSERWIILPEGANENTQANFSEILAVHAVLLPNGKVLYFGGSQHIYDPTLHSVNDPRLDNTRLWNPQTGQVEKIESPHPLYDLFCCGHSFLADGKLLVAGGTSGYPPPPPDFHHEHYRGTRRASLFDPNITQGNPWITAQEMNVDPANDSGAINDDGTHGSGGRWYPTLLMMGDGRIAAFGGHPEEADTRHSNYTVEAFGFTPSPIGAWTVVSEEPRAVISASGELRIPEIFPRAHLLPNGRIFIACLADGKSYSWDPYNRRASAESGWETIASFRTPLTNPGDPSTWNDTYFDNGRLNYSRTFFAWSSVLLPLLPEEGYNARVLVVGRLQPYIINLGRRNDPWPPNSQWQRTAPRDTSNPILFMPSPHRPQQIPEPEPGPGRDPIRYTNHPGMRQQCFSILMPDATVLVVGGSTTNPSDWSGYYFDGVLLPEIYDPSQGRWKTLGTAAIVPRVYHGVALLLPDGRVWTAGSNPWGDGQPSDYEHRIEIFEPWYFDQPRPSITRLPEFVKHGQSFELVTPHANIIRRVALIHAGSVTHGFNFDQRYIGLEFNLVAPDRLSIKAPPDAWVAPPGYYLVFISNEAGIPSEGRFIRISFAWVPWFSLGPDTLTFPQGSTITALSTVPGGTSLYVIGPDGQVWTNFFPDINNNPQWNGWSNRPLGPNVFPSGSVVTALSNRGQGSTSLYVIGLDGHVWTNFFPDINNNPQWNGWSNSALGGDIHTFPQGSKVTALSLSGGATSLYVLDSDGKVWSKYFPDPRRPGQWADWFSLGPDTLTFPQGSTITALSTVPGGTSLYVIGPDGQVWSTFFDPRI